MDGGERVMKGHLEFSPLFARWYFMNEETECPLHCGYAVELRVGDRYYPGRMEFCDEGWYVILQEDPRRRVSFVLKRKCTYAARLPW